MLIGLVSTCGDYGLANILYIIQRLMTLMQIAVPIVSIVALVRILRKKIVNPDDSKLKNSIKNWLLALILFFILPVFVDIAVSNADMAFNNKTTSDYSVSACWRAAKEHSTLINTKEKDNGYIETKEEQNKKHIIK